MDHVVKNLSDRARAQPTTERRTDDGEGSRSDFSDEPIFELDQVSHSYSASLSDDAQDEEDGEAMVYLNVYDLDEQFVQFNNALTPFFTGAFHAGIQCYGLEFCYGMTEEERSGVYWHAPQKNPVHIFRKAHRLGRTHLTREAYKRLMQSYIELWKGNDYHLYRKNCISFCENLAQDLQVHDKFPTYVSSLMNTATKAADGYNAASGFIQTASQSYRSTMDTIGDEIVDGLSKASSSVLTGFNIFGYEVLKAAPSFFGMTYPQSDDEEDFDSFETPVPTNDPLSDDQTLNSIPPSIGEYMTVPPAAKELDKRLNKIVDSMTSAQDNETEQLAQSQHMMDSPREMISHDSSTNSVFTLPPQVAVSHDVIKEEDKADAKTNENITNDTTKSASTSASADKVTREKVRN